MHAASEGFPNEFDQRAGGERPALLTLSTLGGAMPAADELNRLVVAVAQRRDRQAFALLFKHFAPRLKTFLMRRALPADVAEEVAQEAMLAVWHKAASFDPLLAGAATWIFTIARNLWIDRQRRARLPDRLPDLSEEPEATPSAEALLIVAEREAALRRAIAALSEEQATVLQLSFFAEQPHAEIARTLGIPLGTVKSRVRLAVARLRGLLEGGI
jgi:RNA polymerase sigma-70 factor (ECF subfamily)